MSVVFDVRLFDAFDSTESAGFILALKFVELAEKVKGLWSLLNLYDVRAFEVQLYTYTFVTALPCILSTYIHCVVEIWRWKEHNLKKRLS